MKTFYRLYGISSVIRCIPLPVTFLFLFTLFTAGAYAQALNAYAQVTTISTTGGGTKSKLTLGNVNQTKHTFAVGEDVIVIQMQDDVIGSNTSNNSTFGTLSAIANAGIYEVGTISAVSGSSITLTTKLTNTFNTGSHSSVQVVSFAKVASYTTTATVTPTVSWDGSQGIGGVIAIQVTGALTLKHSVIADGAGFAGGAISTNYEVSCEPTVYISSSSNYAGKGEGIYVANNSNYTYGRAPILTGGGGGSDDNGGGAGGGNYSAGGDGGPGWTCASTPSGGMGGISLSSYLAAGTRVFLGGGGGGGQGNNSHQTAGGSGGGIIIIKAGTLTTNCSLTSPIVISANGSASASTANGGNDGAGGAGAAGTILFQVTTYSVSSSCPLATQANGGNGGDVTDVGAHGGGGGGGQGALIFTGGSPYPNITYSTTSGTGGLNSASVGATRAGSGGGSANAGVIAGGGVVLPVHVLNFGAESKNNQVVVRWSGDNDADLTYNIQHATDGIHYTTIGSVKGTSNAVAVNYAFTDYNATTGANFYRLEMVGSLGASNGYSEIASVNLSALQSVPVAYPNPAHSYFNLRSNNLNNNNDYTVTITDLTGKIISVTRHKPAGGVITVSLNSPLKPGLYMYKLSSTDTEQSGKLMIQ
jgi:hypothetical protein